MQFIFVYFIVFIVFKIKYKIKKNENQLKWEKFDTAGTNYLTTMTNTSEPSPERNETKQTEDPNLELNEENPEDELHEDLNQLRILSDELKNTREHEGTLLCFPHHINTKHYRIYQHCP